MADGRDWTGTITLGLLIGAGIVGYRLLKKSSFTAGVVARDVKMAAQGAAQDVADELFDIPETERISNETNKLLTDTFRRLQETTDPAEKLRLDILRLKAVKREALALGNVWGLESSLQRKLAELRELEGGQ